MKIKWYGHACFRIEGDDIRIVTDPYTPEVAGLEPMDESADVVVMSSATDRFHSDASMVPGDPKILNALEIAGRGPVEVNNVVFEALPTMESLRHKQSPDENAIYRFELEDMKRAIEEIRPRVVIPMHYQIPKLKLDILPLEAFTSRYSEDAVTKVGATEVKFSFDTLPRTLRIYVLETAG